MLPVLSVRHLRVEFATRRATLTAIDDVSFDIMPGEVLGVVGESGAGKSVTGAAIIGLIEPPGRIARDEIRLRGERIDTLSAAAMRRIRGRRIGMVFQDPLTSLDPLYRIGEQLEETIGTHSDLRGAALRRKAVELLSEVGFRRPKAASTIIRISSLGGCASVSCSLWRSPESPNSSLLTSRRQRSMFPCKLRSSR